MERNKVVTNTSPLINLALIDRLQLLEEQFDEVIVPEKVLDEVDEGNSVELSGSSTGFNSPSYSWSFKEDPTGSVNLNSENTRKASFVAPDNVDSDQDVEVRLRVTDDQNSKSATSTATVTVVNTDIGNIDSGSSSSGGSDSDDSPVKIVDEEEDGEEKNQESDNSDEDSSEDDED